MPSSKSSSSGRHSEEKQKLWSALNPTTLYDSKIVEFALTSICWPATQQIINVCVCVYACCDWIHSILELALNIALCHFCCCCSKQTYKSIATRKIFAKSQLFIAVLMKSRKMHTKHNQLHTIQPIHKWIKKKTQCTNAIQRDIHKNRQLDVKRGLTHWCKSSRMKNNIALSNNNNASCLIRIYVFVVCNYICIDG